MENHSGGSEVLPGNQRTVIDMVVHFGKIKNMMIHLSQNSVTIKSRW